MVVSPFIKEAATWFALGSAMGAFLCATVFVLAASAPGMGGSAAVARAVGKGLDSYLFPDTRPPPSSPVLRQARRSYDLLC